MWCIQTLYPLVSYLPILLSVPLHITTWFWRISSPMWFWAALGSSIHPHFCYLLIQTEMSWSGAHDLSHNLTFSYITCAHQENLWLWQENLRLAVNSTTIESPKSTTPVEIPLCWTLPQQASQAGVTDYLSSRTRTGITAASLHLWWFSGTWTFHPTLHPSSSSTETHSRWKCSFAASGTQMLIPNHWLSRSRQWTHANRCILAISRREPMTAEPVTVHVLWCDAFNLHVLWWDLQLALISSPFNYLVLDYSNANVIWTIPMPMWFWGSLGSSITLLLSPGPPETSWSGAHKVSLAVCQLPTSSVPIKKPLSLAVNSTIIERPKSTSLEIPSWYCHLHIVLCPQRASQWPPHCLWNCAIDSYLVSQCPEERSIHFTYPSKMTWRLISKGYFCLST